MQPSSLWPLTGLPSRWPRLDGYMADRQSFDVEQALARARSLGLGSHSAAARLLGGIVEKSWIHAASQLAKPSDTLHWPVPSGWYVRGWGSGEGGYHLAVDIMGATGERVLAAAGGIVGYAGNAVRGYGNLVMVIHAGGWVTIYAHNSRNLVVAGQQVRGGESIALVGSTGISRGPHVHFEFVVNGRNCDPVPLFRPAVRHRDGRDANVRQLAWTTGEPSPAGVSCDRRRRHPHSRWHQHHDEVSTTLD